MHYFPPRHGIGGAAEGKERDCQRSERTSHDNKPTPITVSQAWGFAQGVWQVSFD